MRKTRLLAILATGERSRGELASELGISSQPWLSRAYLSPLMAQGYIAQFDYTYDAAGRRIAIAKSGSAFGDLSGSIDSYTYNARSELISARRTKNGQPIPGFSEDFDYDPIGNRRSSATYNEKGEAQTSTYQANNLNQYTMRTTPGYAAVRGEADSAATITVNENPTFRLGEYYFGSDTFDNSTASGYANLETYATLSQTAANDDESEDLVSATTNQVYLAQSPETFAYDDDGNQTLITTKTGLWRVTYNGENRPILWVRDSDGTTLVMSYDHMGRRRAKNAQRFFYDGYLQLADNGGNGYAWDCTERVATRPLVWIRDTIAYYAHDGNKNVSEVFAAIGSVSAHYEYAPFGAVILWRGESAAANHWQFSGEHIDDELGCAYYNYRHYESRIGSWLSRDPIEENGGLRIYGFCRNMHSAVDFVGLKNYMVGVNDPTYTPDPGAGNWGSEMLSFDLPIYACLRNEIMKALVEAAAADWVVSLFGGNVDYPNARRHLMHYFGNTGTQLELDMDSLLGEEAVKSALKDEFLAARKFAETLGDGVHNITSTDFSTGYCGEGDWYYAMGGFHAWGKGIAEVHGPCIALQFEFKVADQYNWDKEKKVTILLIDITDEFMGEFHRKGLAREFYMEGAKQYLDHWVKGAPLGLSMPTPSESGR